MNPSTQFLGRSLLALSLLTGCLSGGGGGGGGTYYSHDELARDFVNRANFESGMSLQLLKSTSNQYDYIVVYDQLHGAYDAYYIGAYNAGSNISDYLWAYQSYNYYWLTPIGNGYYRDNYTGTLFEKQNVSGKNLAKMKALKEELLVRKSAEGLRENYGLSVEKSVDAARFAYKLANAPSGSYKASDYDAFSKEFIGSSISEFQGDFKSGNIQSLKSRIADAAEITGMGTEGVNLFIQDVFLKH